MVFDADMQAVIDAAAAGRPNASSEPLLAQIRARAAGTAKALGEGPDVARVEELLVPTGTVNPIPTRLLVPSSAPSGLVVYFHGGGWVTGDREGWDAMGRVLAMESECAVALVDYRLAPEHLFPAAVDDALAATKWLGEQRVAHFGRTVPLVVAGDSAGGNLAAVVAQNLGRDEQRLAAQVLIYPILNAHSDTGSYVRHADAPFLPSAAMHWYWDQYVPDVAQRADVRASPARASDLRGCPPAIIVAAEVDPLTDEGLHYAGALGAAGVTVTWHHVRGVTHGFLGMVNHVKASRETIRFIAQNLRPYLKNAG